MRCQVAYFLSNCIAISRVGVWGSSILPTMGSSTRISRTGSKNQQSWYLRIRHRLRAGFFRSTGGEDCWYSVDTEPIRKTRKLSGNKKLDDFCQSSSGAIQSLACVAEKAFAGLLLF